MAQPFFRGNYGSALARVDTRPIMEAGRAQGQMYANLGGQIGGMIKEYGLNKQKREEMTNEIESSIKMNPGIVERLTGTGDETFDKKQQTAIEKLTSGDLNMTGLKGLAGDIARLEKQDLKAQAEATAKSQAISDQLNQELIRQSIQGKKISNEESNRIAKLEKEKGEQKDQMYEWGNERIRFLIDESYDNPDFDPAELDIRDQKLFANYQLWSTRNYPLSEFIGKPGDKVELDALRQGYKQAKQNYEKGEFELESAKKQATDANRIPMFKDNAAVLDYKASLPSGATAKFNKKGTGFDLESISLTAEEEDKMTQVPGIPDHYLYSGGLYRTKEVKGKKIVTKVTAQSFDGDTQKLEEAIKLFQTPELTQYAKAKALAYETSDTDGGQYIYKDKDDIDTIVPYSPVYEFQLAELNQLKAEYKRRLRDSGSDVIDMSSSAMPYQKEFLEAQDELKKTVISSRSKIR